MNPWIFVAFFVFFSFISEAMTGFGSIVIALSLGALFLPIPELLAVLVPLSVCMSSFVLARNWRHIHWPTLWKLLLPAMALGTLIGFLLRPHVDPLLSKIMFGALIVWFASRELYKLIRKPALEDPRNPWATRALTLGAGVTHGLFASGGPLLVYALAGNRLDKTNLRATLVFIWFSMNASMTIGSIIDGSIRPVLPIIGALIPVIALSWFIGEKMHHRVNEVEFRKVLYALLVFVGVLLFIPSMATLLAG